MYDVGDHALRFHPMMKVLGGHVVANSDGIDRHGAVFLGQTSIGSLTN